MKNYGVILGKRDEDYIAGVQSPLGYEERNPSGDWRDYLPSEERQSSNFADSMACVSFSALNCVETQLKFVTGVEPNYSDRALAKMSNTTTQGNYLWRVADTIRLQGIVEEQYWPAPVDFTWDTYYTEIPADVKNMAAGFLEKYDIKHEWLPENTSGTIDRDVLKYHLKHAPVQVVRPGHAIMCFYSGASVDKYFDHYDPFIKSYSQPFLQAMKYIVTPKNNPMFELWAVAGSPEVWLIRDGKKTHVYNAAALTAVSGFDKIIIVPQAQLDAVPDTGGDIAWLQRD